MCYEDQQEAKIQIDDWFKGELNKCLQMII